MTRGYLWQHLAEEVVAEFRTLTGASIDLFPSTMSGHEAAARRAERAEIDRELEQFAGLYRDLRRIEAARRRGRIVDGCTKCGRPREGQNKLCDYHGDIARRAAAAWNKRRKEDMYQKKIVTPKSVMVSAIGSGSEEGEKFAARLAVEGKEPKDNFDLLLTKEQWGTILWFARQQAEGIVAPTPAPAASSELADLRRRLDQLETTRTNGTSKVVVRSGANG